MGTVGIDDDDGYLHFEKRNQGTLGKYRMENMDNGYSYNQPRNPFTEEKEPPNDKEKSKITKKKSIFSRKCLLVSLMVNVCTVTAIAVIMFYIMNASLEKCSGTSMKAADKTGTQTKFTSTDISTSFITSPSTTSSPIKTSTELADKTGTQTKFTSTDISTSFITSLSTTSIPLSLRIDELCRENESLIVPHPHECQAFYNCSREYKHEFALYIIPQHFAECDYPQLFNDRTLSCDDFENVDCGTRSEAKSGCDYRLLRCYGSCRHCSADYPSCKGMNNGRNERREIGTWIPSYILCFKERWIGSAECPRDHRGITQLFSPLTKSCERLEFVPREFGGWMTDCMGKPNGIYPAEEYKCNGYHICRGGEHIDYVECGNGLLFDEISKTCRSLANTCVCSQQSGCERNNGQ